MLGQHPEMYGLPEVNLFVAETMRERQALIARPKFSEHGLLRVVAQVIMREQTVRAVTLAQAWIKKRWDSTWLAVFQELAERVGRQTFVDKSPRTVTKCEYMRRVHGAFPNTRFIHLLRHPRSYGESLWKIGGPYAATGLGALDHGTDPPTLDYQKAWYSLNMNIVTFLDGVPEGHQMRIRGEDLLADPDTHVREIARWLGVRTDAEAIEAMKHPERSPYACPGPVNARFGNDPNFLQSPALRPSRGPVRQSLDGPLPWRGDGGGFSPEVKDLAREFGYK
jgi:sulfotransferase family protein